MLTLRFFDIMYTFPIIFFMSFSTVAFLKFNSTTSFIKNLSVDKKKIKTNISKKNYTHVLIKFIILCIIFLNITVFLYQGYINSIWNSHFFLNNFSYKYIFFFYKIFFLLICLFYCLSLSRINFSIDYIYASAIILVSAPMLFLSGNFFIFYFLLEFIVCLTFLMFVVSKFWFKSSLNLGTKRFNEKYKDYTPKMHTNTLFFQYWISFFSSILLLFFFLNLEFYFGSTNWAFLSFSNKYILLPNFFFILFYIFIFAFFLKLGVTPVHLYKIELYKGLPFISLFLYTIIFFFIFYFYFIVLFLFNFYSFRNFFWISFFILLIVGLLYVVVLLFDINFMKAFFAYSTIINSTSFLLLLLSSF